MKSLWNRMFPPRMGPLALLETFTHFSHRYFPGYGGKAELAYDELRIKGVVYHREGPIYISCWADPLSIQNALRDAAQKQMKRRLMHWIPKV